MGADESNIKKQKRNLAVATGKGFAEGTSSTIAIAWTYGRDAQPDIRTHMDHIEAWLRYYDKYRSTEKESAMQEAWFKAAAKTKGAERKGKKATTEMTSAMSACITSLRLIDIEPWTMHEWKDTEFDKGSIRLDVSNQNI